MVKSSYKAIGLFLIFGALFVAVLLQVSSWGLVDLRPSSLHRGVIVDPQNPHLVTIRQETARIHLLRICPLLAVMDTGLLCVLVSQRKEA
jgi:hypothetical protein